MVKLWNTIQGTCYIKFAIHHSWWIIWKYLPNKTLKRNISTWPLNHHSPTHHNINLADDLRCHFCSDQEKTPLIKFLPLESINRVPLLLKYITCFCSISQFCSRGRAMAIAMAVFSFHAQPEAPLSVPLFRWEYSLKPCPRYQEKVENGRRQSVAVHNATLIADNTHRAAIQTNH